MKERSPVDLKCDVCEFVAHVYDQFSSTTTKKNKIDSIRPLTK